MFSKKIKMVAFTLAEVLITLAVVGVIAAVMIPTLNQRSQERKTIAAVKKAYSTLSQAYTSAIQDNQTIDTWGITGASQGVDGKLVFDTLAPYLKVTKNCGQSPGCFPTGVIYKRLEGGVDSDRNTALDSDVRFTHAQLIDGSIIALNAYNSNPEYAVATVDINGYNGPNKYGVDAFQFYFLTTKIVPGGAPKGGHYAFPLNCNKDAAITDVLNRNGLACAAWVIYEDNLDYLHCSGLSWNGPTECQ